MIHIEKDLSKVPVALTNKKTDFENAVTNKKYKGESYNVVQQDLIDLYNDKCGYCETLLKNNFRAVEHYRPKNNNPKVSKCDASYGYYWLALSWSNLILSCSYCNSFKGSCFNIKNQSKRVSYKNETFEEIHLITEQYNKEEEPLLLHPEIDNPEDLISFDTNAEVKLTSKRVKYTVETCNLNRKDLIELRYPILKSFKDNLMDIYNDIKDDKELTFQQKLNHFKREIISFSKLANNDKSNFLAWRRYILKNYQIFLFHPTNKNFNAILKLVFLKFIPKN